MTKTYLYLPEELNELIIQEAKNANLSKAETLRILIREGIKTMTSKRNNSSSILRDAEIIGRNTTQKKYKDLSSNLDAYLWKDKNAK